MSEETKVSSRFITKPGDNQGYLSFASLPHNIQEKHLVNTTKL